MTVDWSALPARSGVRPRTTGREIPHDQLDQFSPPEIRAELIARAERLPGVLTGPSQLSEPSSLAFRMRRPNPSPDAFLLPGHDEFGHVHRSGFLHLTVPREAIGQLTRLGWTEPHPITRRPEFPDTIVMFYAPRDEAELDVATTVLRASWEQAYGPSAVPTGGEH